YDGGDLVRIRGEHHDIRGPPLERVRVALVDLQLRRPGQHVGVADDAAQVVHEARRHGDALRECPRRSRTPDSRGWGQCGRWRVRAGARGVTGGLARAGHRARAGLLSTVSRWYPVCADAVAACCGDGVAAALAEDSPSLSAIGGICSPAFP